MPLDRIDREQRVDAPVNGSTTTRTLSLTTTSASITLAEGVHEVINPSSIYVWAAVGVAATGLPPASGDPAVAGFPVPPLTAVLVTIPNGGGDLHAKSASGTPTVYIVHKVTA